MDDGFPGFSRLFPHKKIVKARISEIRRKTGTGEGEKSGRELRMEDRRKGGTWGIANGEFRMSNGAKVSGFLTPKELSAQKCGYSRTCADKYFRKIDLGVGKVYSVDCRRG